LLSSKLRLQEETMLVDKAIADAEDALLFRLAAGPGNLLDETGLLDFLTATTESTQELYERQRGARVAANRVSASAEQYRPLSARAALMFQVVEDLAKVNPNYATSLDTFTDCIFEAALHPARDNVGARRIAEHVSALTFHIFSVLDAATLPTHRHLVAFLIALRTELEAGHVSPECVAALIKPFPALATAKLRPRPAVVSWLDDTQWGAVAYLATQAKIGRLSKLTESLVRTPPSWQSWIGDAQPERATLPEEYATPNTEGGLNTFERLLLVRALRPDRAGLAMVHCIRAVLGETYLDPLPLDLSVTAASTPPTSPIMLFLAPGGDPTSLIQTLAKRKKKDLKIISLGEGQGAAATSVVRSSISSGTWALIANGQLDSQVLHELEDIMRNTAEVHPEFRLWVTVAPTADIPRCFTQISTKVALDQAVGLRGRLTQLYHHSFNQDTLDTVPRSHDWRSVLFALGIMHCIFLERRKFDSLGWAEPFDLFQGDIHTACHIAQNRIADAEAGKKDINWTWLQYLIGDLVYAGRLANRWDVRLMDAYVDRFLRPGIVEHRAQVLPGLTMPYGANIVDYRQAIDTLPRRDDPSILGLGSCAQLQFGLQTSEAFFGALHETLCVDVHPERRPEHDGMAVAEEMLRTLPEDEVVDVAKMHALDNSKFLHRHLRSEAMLFLSQLREVRQLLHDVIVTGSTHVPSTSLRSVLHELGTGSLPPALARISWPGVSLATWSRMLGDRTHLWHSVSHRGLPLTLCPAALTNIKGLLAAIVSDHARDARNTDNTPFEHWSPSLQVTKYMDMSNVKEKPDQGVYLHGLWLDGAAWDAKEQCLKDPSPLHRFNALPVVHATATAMAAPGAEHKFECPCFRSSRTELVGVAYLSSDVAPVKWILHGVAMVCERPD